MISIHGDAQAEDLVKADTDRGGFDWCALLWFGDNLSLYLAFEEEWQIVKKSKTDWRSLAVESGPVASKLSPGAYVFGGLRLRFYLRRQSESASIRQWLRCEWEPFRFLGKQPLEGSSLSLQDIADQIVFDADSAAHPHFHFDSIPLTSAAVERFAALHSSATTGGFGSTSNGFEAFQSGFITSTESELRHVHLPSNADWVSRSFDSKAIPNIDTPLPHQRYPASTSDLDNWFAWTVSYFSSQFEKYVDA